MVDLNNQSPSGERADVEHLVSRRVILRAAGMLGALIAAGGPAAMIARQNARAQDDAGDSPVRSVDWAEAENDASVQVASGDGFTTINTEFPITTAGAHWPNEVGLWPVIEIRLSLDGNSYTDSFFLGYDQDIGKETRENRHYTTLVMSGGARFIQYRVVDQNGEPQSIPGLVITYIDASEGPILDDLPSVSVATTDPATPPPIISRQGWGADESLRFRGGVELWPVTYATVEHGIVHHSETSNVQDPVIAMRAIYYYHAITRDWGDIAYNFLIDRSGFIYEGRIGGQNAVGSHATLYNHGSSGVCLIGNFIFQDMSVQAKASLVAILAWVVRDLDPLGFADFWNSPNLPIICSHRDVGPTTCPGDFAYDDLPEIRALVAETLALADGELPGGLTIGDTVQVVTDDGGPLNMRSAPGLASDVLVELPDETLGIVVDGPESDGDGNWYRLSTNLGTGWCTAEFLELAPPGLEGGGEFTIGDIVAVDVESLNLYGMPRSSASVIYRVFHNQLGRIVAGPKFSENQIWYQFGENSITGGFATGWAIQERFRLSTEPPSEPQPSFVAGDTVRTTASLNLRSGPSTGSSIITTMGIGTVGTVLAGPFSGSGLTWYQIQVAAGTGYAAEQYLQEVVEQPPPPPPEPEDPEYLPGDVLETTAGLRLRTSPSTSGGVIGTMPAGTLGTVVSGPQTASGYDWWQIATSLGTGWAAGSFLRKSTSVPPPPPSARFESGDTVVTISAVNFRSSPSTSASIITLLQTGIVGTVVSGPETGSGYTWWRVTMPQGTGWVADPFLAASTSAPPDPPTPQYLPGASVRTTASLRLRGTPSTSGATIKIMALGSISTIQGGPQFANGYTWWQILNGADSGWAAGTFLTPA